MYMTSEEAQEYRHLLDRKKKALSLDRREREKYQKEWEKIVEGTDKKVLDYVYFVIGPKRLENAPSKRIGAILDIRTVWEELIEFEKNGEGEKIEEIAKGIKALYDSLEKAGYGADEN